jgi:tellurite resistance protein TehA-like permease
VTTSLRDLTRPIAPDAGGAVMATGIVSVVLRLHAFTAMSRVLLAIACAMWAALSVAALLYASLLPRTFGIWRGRCGGSAFLLVVAPQSLAVLAAELARREHRSWLALAALAPFALALCAYALVLAHYDLRRLRIQGGEHWIAGGALAISTLACAELAQAAAAVAWLHALEAPLRDAALALWAATMAWLALLIGAALRWPRLRYRTSRWATVFPLGMYAAMSFAVSVAVGATWMDGFARAWTWVAVAGWLVVAAGFVRRVWLLLR